MIKRRYTVVSLLCLLSVLLSIYAFPLSAAAAVLSKDYELDWVYEYEIDGGIGETVVVRMFLDGEIVFCVQPHVGNNTGDVYNPPIPAELFYSAEVLERLGLIAHYGYHTGDGSLLSAGFSMMMMHHTVGFPIGGIYDYTGQGVFTPEAYASFCASTEYAISRYNTPPSFDGMTLILTTDSDDSITDENGVLSGYQVVETPEGVTAVIEGNTLFVSADQSSGGGRIVLERILSNVGVPLLFLLEGKQNLVKALVEAPRRAELFIEVDTTGGFTLEKSSTEGGLIDGSRFEVRGASLARTVAVDGGRVVVEDLPPGMYDVQEVVSPFGFRIDDSIRQVEVAAGQIASDVTLNVSNEPERANVEILKVDEALRPVQGAVFELSRETDFTGSTLTAESDIDGIAAFFDLALYLGKTVYIREIDAPPHLICDQTVHALTLADGETYRLELTNKFADSSVHVLKVDLNDNPIRGARFELSRKENFTGKIVEAVTDENGRAVFSGLSVRDGSTVYVRETYVPPPYIRDQRVLEAVIKPGEILPLTFQNDYAVARISVIKRDALDESLLEGVTYGLFSGGEEIARQVTGADGTAEFGFFLPGDYTIREIEALPGFIRDETEHVVSVTYIDDLTAPEDVLLELQNRPVLGRVKVSKRGEQDGEPIAGAIFALIDESGNEVDRFVSAENGEALSGEHRAGHYTVIEVDAPGAYYLTDAKHEVEIREDGVTIEVNFTNERIEFVLRILKHDLETLEPLAGAVFELFDEEGRRLEIGTGDGEGRFQIRTDLDGRAVTNLKLQAGTYRISEVLPPPGYARSADKMFTVGRDTPVIELTWFGRTVEQLVGNAPTVTGIEKTDWLTGEPVEGALLLLHETESGAVVDVWTSSAAPHRLKKLVAGRSYTVSELLTPVGYAKGAETVFTVEETTELQIVRIENRPTALVVKKFETGTGIPVKNALFRLLDSDKHPLTFVCADGCYMPDPAGTELLPTDEEGNIVITYLPVGNYILSEHAAPGYLKEKEGRLLRLTDRHTAEKPLEVVVENEYLEIFIQKIDSDSKEPLTGAVFTLSDQEGSLIGFEADGNSFSFCAGNTETAVTRLPVDNAGRLCLRRLLPGRYELIEITAPEGYEICRPSELIVTGDEERSLNILVANKKKDLPFPDVALPVTGEMPPSSWPILGLLCLMNGAGIASIRSLRKKRRR